MPRDYDPSRHRFYEPFVGSGVVMFSLQQLVGQFPNFREQKRRLPIVINDVNPELIATYRSIRSDVENLILKLNELQRDVSKEAFHRVRARQPTDDVERAARLIYLVKTSFNGLYRVNSSGKYNVPWGRKENVEICDQRLLRTVSKWLQNVVIREGSYLSACDDAREGDIVYFDPPYLPTSPTSNFSKYHRDDFGMEEHRELASFIETLTQNGVRVLLSNSNTSESIEIFAGMNTKRVVRVSRSIAADPNSRGMVGELIACNYSVDKCRAPHLVQELPSIRMRNS